MTRGRTDDARGMDVRRGFSLIELVIVVVIMGIIAAIAVPRMGSAAETARGNRLVGDLRTLQEAADRYTIEHWGKNPGVDAAGDPVDAGTLVSRLLGTTHEDGTLHADGIYGPYLRAWPSNAVNGLDVVIVAEAPGTPSAYGWRFKPSTGEFIASGEGGASTPLKGDAAVTGQLIDTVGGVKLLDGTLKLLGG